MILFNTPSRQWSWISAISLSCCVTASPPSYCIYFYQKFNHLEQCVIYKWGGRRALRMRWSSMSNRLFPQSCLSFCLFEQIWFIPETAAVLLCKMSRCTNSSWHQVFNRCIQMHLKRSRAYQKKVWCYLFSFNKRWTVVDLMHWNYNSLIKLLTISFLLYWW